MPPSTTLDGYERNPSRMLRKERLNATLLMRETAASFLLEDLRELPKCFTLLPHQAIECQLDGMVEYAGRDGVVHILSDLLLGKSFFAEVHNREDPVSVVLFDKI